MSTTHLYSAADGRRLDGRKGKKGLVHVAFHENDTYDKPDIRFYPGTAGAHAVQMNGPRLTRDSIGYLGGFTGGIFFDPHTLDELRFPDRIRFRRADERLDMLWRGQTHVAWDPIHPRRFIVAIGFHFWEYDLDHPEHPRLLGRHGVSIPHALKRVGDFLVYGAMDSNTTGPARCIGIFDLRTNEAQEPIHLDDTAWHLTVGPDHQGRMCAWAVSELYGQGPAKSGQQTSPDARR